MQIELLGPPRVAGDTAVPRRERVVLQALVIGRGRVVNADQLADAVWGDAEPSSWATQVHICIAHLRRRLSGAAIETVGNGYRLTVDGDEVDVYAFEQLVRRGRELLAADEPDRASTSLTRALELWRGEPYDDLDGWEPGTTESARLTELLLSTEEDLAEAQLALGQHRAVVPDAESLVAQQPLRERRSALVALALYRSGRQADALRALTRARRMLAEQLGIDPGPELTALEAAILRQEPELVARRLAEVAAACPYKGLMAYDADDADVFYGRQSEVGACLARLETSAMLVLAGPSGCGKSSLARAGVAPVLRARGRAVTVCVPGSDPVGALASALAAGGHGAVLVVDQFEELFSNPDSETIGAVLHRLTERAEAAPVVICVRADFLAGLSAEHDFARLAERGLYLLGSLTGDSLREAIEAPAREAGLRLEHGLVDLLIRDTEGQPGALPLLSHALVETWKHRDGNTLTVEGYRSSGGISGAVARSADQLYDSLPADQRAVLRGLVLRLVSPTLEGEPVRSRVATAAVTGDRAREHVIGLLVRARLVTAAADTYELAHEALVRGWPRLQAWLDEDTGGQRVLRHLATAAAEWETLGRPDSELYRGARLESAREWRATGSTEMTVLEAQFLDASEARNTSEQVALEARAARDARQNRRLRRAIALVAALLCVALAAGAVAAVQRNRADTNSDRAEAARTEAVAHQQIAAQDALVNASLAVRGGRRDLAALLAIEAHRRSPSAATENALFGLFTQFPGVGPTVDFAEGTVVGSYMELLPDGQTIAASSETGAVRLIDVATGHNVALLETGAEHATFGWSEFYAATPDSRLLAVSVSRIVEQPDGAKPFFANLSVWDLATREPIFNGVEVPTIIGSLSLSADGRLLAAAGGDDGRTLILDATSGKVLRELEPIPEPEDAQYFTNTVAVAFMSDDRLIVTSQAGPIRIVDPRTGTELQRFDSPRETAEATAILAPDESWLLTAGARGVMRFDLPAGAPAWNAPSDHVCAPTAVAPIGLVLCPEAGGRVTTIDFATGGLAPNRFEGVTGAASTGATPDGSTVIVFGDQRYTLWRTDGAGLVNRVLSRPDTPFIAGYTADGSRLLLDTEGDDGPAVEVVDASTGEVVDRIAGATMVRPTPAPDRVVMRFADGKVGWYDLVARAPTGTAVDPGFDPAILVATSQGALAWWFDKHIVALDLTEGRVLAPDPPIDQEVWRVEVSPDGRLYTAPLENYELQRRDPATWAERASTTVDAIFGAVAAGSNQVVMGDSRGSHYLLDPDTLEVVGTLPATRGSFSDLKFDTREDRLLTIGEDREIRLYDLGERLQLGVGLPFNSTAPYDDRGQRGLALRPDGRQAAFDIPGGIAIWDLDPDHWVAAACQLASRNLTHEEWDAYIGNLADYHATCPEFAISG